MGDEHSVETQIAVNGEKLDSLRREIGEQHTAIKEDVRTKHIQNRKSIHRLANDIQKCTDLITGIRISNARWNIGAGIITALLTALIHHLLK